MLKISVLYIKMLSLLRRRHLTQSRLYNLVFRSIKTVTQDQFWDTRDRYRAFCALTTEKRNTGNAIVDQLFSSTYQLKSICSSATPTPIFIYDAGMGDGKILNKVLKGMHALYPNNPFVVVAKEVSTEDISAALEILGERFIEHPETLLCLTRKPFANINHSVLNINESLTSNRCNVWKNIILPGTNVLHVDRHLEFLSAFISESGIWSGNSKQNNEITICRNDKFLMFKEIIKNSIQNGRESGCYYDAIIASQPFRNRASATFKCEKILIPLAQALKPGGSLIVVHSTGDCPAMKIFPSLAKEAFPVSTQKLIDTFTRMEDRAEEDYSFSRPVSVNYEMNIHSISHQDDKCYISTSFANSVWKTIAYVAQLGEQESSQKWNEEANIYQTITAISDIWFSNDLFTITRK